MVIKKLKPKKGTVNISKKETFASMLKAAERAVDKHVKTSIAISITYDEMWGEIQVYFEEDMYHAIFRDSLSSASLTPIILSV
jgi:biotin carboxylase